MSYYPSRIDEHFCRPHNIGEIEDASAVGEAGSLTCGALLKLSLKIDSLSHVISAAKFKVTGCGVLIAGASVLTEMLTGRALGEVAAMFHNLENTIAVYFNEIPANKIHCVRLCREALDATIMNYRAAALEEWTGEEALICTCFGVSEKTIESAIQTEQLQTITQITRACNAGGGCGSCHPLIEDMLDTYWHTGVKR
jgi:NifU-like protein